MKTSPNNNSICEHQESFSFASALSSAWWSLLKVCPVRQVGQVGQNVYTSLHLLQQTRRHNIGFIMVGLAPISSVLFLLFDPTPPPIEELEARLAEWYFLSWYYFLLALAPYLFMLFGSLGTFLLSPTKYKISYIGAVVSVSYAVLRIIHISFFVTSHEDYNNHSWISIVSACSIAIGLLLTLDYLVYRKYHPIDGALRRIIGMARTPGIPAEQKVEIMKQLSYEWENLNSKI